MTTSGMLSLEAGAVTGAAAHDDMAARLEKLEASLAFLLINQMNAQTPAEIGPASHKRLVERFLLLLKQTGPKLFLDIGANDASTAVFVKQYLPQCKVMAFEANPTVHATYNSGVTAQGVDYVNLAIGPRDGVTTIYAPVQLSKGYVDGAIVPLASVEPKLTGKSSLLRRNEDATYEEHIVRAVSLDSLLRDHAPDGNARDIALWIDVEGAAFDVLAGGRDMLARSALIFIESENHAFWTAQKQCGDVARLLIAAGFLPLQRDREYGDKQFNTIFLHHSLASLVDANLYEAVAPLVVPQPVKPAAATAPLKKSYGSLAACLVAEIPVFVPTFNNPTYAANMLRQLKERGIRNVFFVDNASTFPPMAEFLDKVSEEATVIRLPENKGPYDLVLSETNYACLPEIFCVTDPDLEFDAAMPKDFLFDLLSLTNKFQVGKAGLALNLADRQDMQDDKFLFGDHYFHIWEWEGQFWQEPLDRMADGSLVYKAKIDTTFALYNKKFFKREFFWEALRVAGPYTCRHLPWYKNTGLPTAEEDHYRATQKFSYYMG